MFGSEMLRWLRTEFLGNTMAFHSLLRQLQSEVLNNFEKSDTQATQICPDGKPPACAEELLRKSSRAGRRGRWMTRITRMFRTSELNCPPITRTHAKDSAFLLHKSQISFRHPIRDIGVTRGSWIKARGVAGRARSPMRAVSGPERLARECEPYLIALRRHSKHPCNR